MTPSRVSANWRWPAALALLLLLAWGLRAYYVAVSVPEQPLRGDAVDYYHYARNLLEHGVFSRARAGVPDPDAYRGPAYPLLLAAVPDFGTTRWLLAVFHLQAIIGALGCALLAAWTRPWLGPRAAWGAGALLALWPHHLAATGMLLVEVTFATMLLLAAWASAQALRRGSPGRGLVAGLAWGAAALVNPIALLFLPLFAVAVAMQRQRRLALALLGGWLLLVGPWEGRSVTLDPAARGAVRAKVNLVQGSWPLYHAAYASRNAHPEPRAIMQRIGEEEALILRDTRAGLRAIFDRMRTRPSTYALWYAYEKPQLLWDWDIRIGAGDVYVHPVARSPLERHPVLRAIKQGLRAVNPALGPLALLAALAWLLAAWRGAPNAERTLAAAVVLYVTAVHVVLQAEPRYATAYRPFEIALLAGLAVGMIRAIGRRPLQPPHSSRQSDAVSH